MLERKKCYKHSCKPWQQKTQACIAWKQWTKKKLLKRRLEKIVADVAIEMTKANAQLNERSALNVKSLTILPEFTCRKHQIGVKAVDDCCFGCIISVNFVDTSEWCGNL